MRIVLACSLWEKIRGLKRFRAFLDILMLVPCKDIHTFGLASDIDIAFLAANGEVLEAYRHVPPRRRVRCPRARAVLERYSTEQPWVNPGDILAIKDIGLPVKS